MAVAEAAVYRENTILHVDDTGVILQTMSRAFGRQGIPYAGMGLASEALDVIGDPRVRAIIIDLLLRPEPSIKVAKNVPVGAELVRRVRKMRPDIPMFILTNHRNDTALHELIESGEIEAAAVFAKDDLVPDVFVEAVRERMRNSSEGTKNERGQMERVSFGRHEYRFRQPISGDELAQRVCQGDLAGEALERAFHITFQRLYNKGPHDMSLEEEELWEFVLGVTDYERYEREFPEPETLVGQLVAKQGDDVTIQWYYSDLRETFDLRSTPGRLATAGIGDTIEATVLRLVRGTEWLSCSTYSSLQDVTEDQLAKVDHVEDAPLGDWPGADE